MTVYGYEQPVLYTPVDIFNPTTANMVLSAMKDYGAALLRDYEEARADEKEFAKEYGSFYSPSATDTQNYYNQTIGGIKNMYAQAQAQGVDLLRSREGRAWLLRFINSRDYSYLNKMKESADNLKMFNKMKAKMMADGTYDQELQDSLGIPNPDTWNTNENGIFNYESPVVAKDLYALTHDKFEPFSKINNDLGPGRNRFYRWKGVDEATIMGTAKETLNYLKSTPYYNTLLKQFGDDDKLLRGIINVNSNVLHKDEEVDKVALAQWESLHSGSGRGRGSDSSKYTLFDEAFRKRQVGYDVKSADRFSITPVDSKTRLRDSGDKSYYILDPKAKIVRGNDALDGNTTNIAMRRGGKSWYGCMFTPVGTLVYSPKTKDYWIMGKITYMDENKNPKTLINQDTGDEYYAMRAKRRNATK